MKARLPQGYGKQSMNQLMAQAQKMQEDVKAKQAELEETLYDVTSGGGMIALTMSGKHQVTKLKIDPAAIDPAAIDPEDTEMLEDLIAAAVNEAVRKVDEASDAAMAEITGGLNIPGLG